MNEYSRSIGKLNFVDDAIKNEFNLQVINYLLLFNYHLEYNSY